VCKKENLPNDRATTIKNKAITIERMVVAKVESIFCKPILPNSATRAAKIAERSA
jgi:hypothetical protein